MSAVRHSPGDVSNRQHDGVRWGRVSSVGLYCVFVVLAVAALAKLTDIPKFRESLESWVLLPRPIRSAVTVVVPSCELVVAGLWLLSIARPLALRLGLLLMVTLTAAYTASWILVGPPECSCLGRLLEYEAARRSWQVAIGRNAVMLLILSAGLVVDVRRLRLARGEDANGVA